MTANRSLSVVLFFASLFTLTYCSDLQRSTIGRSSTTPRSSDVLLREQVVDFATRQIGTRYRSAGRSPQRGFDCSGFTYFVLDEFDIDVPPVSRSQETEGRSISLNAAQAGDLVFFRRSRSGPVFHVAMVVSNDREGLRVIHSTTSRGVVIDNVDESSYWRPKLSTARDIISTR